MEFRMSLKTASSSRRVHTSSVCPSGHWNKDRLALAVPSLQPCCGSCCPAGGQGWIPVLALPVLTA